jgi:hypothetical protein
MNGFPKTTNLDSFREFFTLCTGFLKPMDVSSKCFRNSFKKAPSVFEILSTKRIWAGKHHQFPVQQGKSVHVNVFLKVHLHFFTSVGCQGFYI